MKRIFPLVFVLVGLLSLSGCLKSRLQFREDSDDHDVAKPVPAQVQEVQPQGQYVIDEIKAEMIRLNGKIDDLEKNKQEGAASEHKEEIKKLENRITELEHAQAQMIEAIKKIQDTTPTAGSDSGDLLEKGIAQVEADDCDTAIETFTNVLKSAKGPKAEDATFYRGQCYFKLKQYKKAIVDFSKFPEKYTKSKHMPVALFRIGTSFEAMGMKDDAKGFYQELIEKFPKSAEAKKAKARVK